MIHLLFELTDPTDDVDGFSRGHIRLTGDRETVNSKDSAEDMMIFIEIPRLLDELQKILLTSKKSCVFESVASRPFGFKVSKTSARQLRVLYQERTIGEAPITDFIQSLWQSTVVFVGAYRAALPHAEDLDRAMQEFEQVITAYQPPAKKSLKPERKR